eukprot:TRINITY_DN8132_c0_g1_i1.p1 TRINITY_DN8132_c0_g1~~TRINITY_DN8132_c0_g1_i1.p1  ORF type:complete len:218 (-),score=45.25 TRINITY_DN8132_c0_g1_i1:20-673(-)
MNDRTKCAKCKHKNEPGWKFCSNCAYKNTEFERATCNYHFVVMGSGGVGKSAITIQFVNRQFEAKYDPTIEDRYQKVIEYKGVHIFLEILDTAGQETFSAMRELYMKNGEGFVLVYSILAKRSFDELDAIRLGIVRHKNTADVPMVLVGNKSDLDKKREVDQAIAKDKARTWNCPFIESSAKKDENIREIFYELIDQVWQKKGPPSNLKKKKACQVL